MVGITCGSGRAWLSFEANIACLCSLLVGTLYIYATCHISKPNAFAHFAKMCSTIFYNYSIPSVNLAFVRLKNSIFYNYCISYLLIYISAPTILQSSGGRPGFGRGGGSGFGAGPTSSSME